jgi:hypothetical protein
MHGQVLAAKEIDNGLFEPSFWLRSTLTSKSPQLAVTLCLFPVTTVIVPLAARKKPLGHLLNHCKVPAPARLDKAVDREPPNHRKSTVMGFRISTRSCG